MKLTRYNNRDHYMMLQEWLFIRSTYLPLEEEMPKIGYVVYKKDLPIAMGFIRRVEGGFGQLDGYVTNPNVNSRLRNTALECLTTQLIQKAKKLGLKSLISFTSDKNTFIRSQRHGFVSVAHALIALDLKDKQHLC